MRKLEEGLEDEGPDLKRVHAAELNGVCGRGKHEPGTVGRRGPSLMILH